VSFVLTESLQIKSVTLLNAVSFCTTNASSRCRA